MSYVIVNKETGDAVCEINNESLIAKLNEKYEAVPAKEYLEYLYALNRKLSRKLGRELSNAKKREHGL